MRQRARESWWPILDSGGCVLPLGTRPATIRRLEVRIDPDPTHRGLVRIEVPHPVEEALPQPEPTQPEPPVPEPTKPETPPEPR